MAGKAGLAAGEAAPLHRIFLFFLPLVVLSVSQSLTYPLVGSIVSHGPGGEQEYASYVMGQQVLFFLGAIGGGLITTAMMFCRNRRGYANYLRMNQCIALTAALLQGLACLPPFDQWVFGGLFGLEGEAFRVARNSLLLCIPLQYVFFVRNPYLGTLFVEKHSDLTNIPTVLRVLLAFYFAWQFPRLGWTGYRWGVLATTIPAVLADHFGMSNISKIHGAVLSAWGVAGLVGNQISLRVFNQWGMIGVSTMLVIGYAVNYLNVLSLKGRAGVQGRSK